MRAFVRKLPAHVVIPMCLAVLLGVWRWWIPERSVDSVGPRALPDALFAIGLWGGVLLLAGGIGQKILAWLKLSDLTALEETILAISMGLGVMAYGVLALGLAGLLRPVFILLWLAVLTVWSWQEWSRSVARLPNLLAGLPRAWKNLEVGARSLCIVGGAIFVLAFFLALAPPWDYDGLMYHLTGPKLFLQDGQIWGRSDIWEVNYPFTIQMLFTVGLAFGSESFARLLHLAFGVGLVLATFAFGLRYRNRIEAWIALAVLISTPILPYWASWAYTDLSWALFEFLGVYCLARWSERFERNWLIAAGLVMGWAAGNKYQALGSVAILGLWILWEARSQGLRKMIVNILVFGGFSALIASPWYLKNWLWAGNPLYPFLFGGPGWGTENPNLWMAYMQQGFGVGRRLVDYLLLPINIYLYSEQFGTSGIESPAPLFLAALFYVVLRKDRWLNRLGAVAGLFFVMWAFSSQQVRFLLPIFPALSLLSARVLTALADILKPRLARIVIGSLIGGAVVATLVYQIMIANVFRPYGVILGLESKDAFLRRVVHDYAVMQFVQDELPASARVLMLWDGQSYYCDARCLPDTDQERWARLVLQHADMASLVGQLQQQEISHVMMSVNDETWAGLHDPTGQNQRAINFFHYDFIPQCGREIYQDDHGLRLYELTCP